MKTSLVLSSIVMAALAALPTSSRVNACEKAKPDRNANAMVKGVPQWTDAYVGVQVAELRKSAFFRRMMTHVMKETNCRTPQLNEEMKLAFGLGLDDIERFDYFTAEAAAGPSVLRISTIKAIDREKLLKIIKPTKKTYKDLVYYFVQYTESRGKRSPVSYSFYFVDDRTLLQFGDDPKNILDASWSPQKTHPLAAELQLARTQQYPILYAHRIKAPKHEYRLKGLGDYYDAETFMLTVTVTDEVRLDAVLNFPKVQRRTGRALQGAVEFFSKTYLSSFTVDPDKNSGKVMAAIADALKNAKARQEWRVQHVPMPLNLRPETFGDAIEEMLKQLDPYWRAKGRGKR